MDAPSFLVVDATSPSATVAMRCYFSELAARLSESFDAQDALNAAQSAFNLPGGLFVVAETTDGPVACGGVHFLDPQRGEIKRMWVAPDARGNGLASGLLRVLENLTRKSGRTRVVLDSSSALTEAVAMYERRGYQRATAYNDNPHADVWFTKALNDKSAPFLAEG